MKLHRVEVELACGVLMTKNVRLKDLIPIVRKRKSEQEGVVRCMPITPTLIDLAFAHAGTEYGPIKKIVVTEAINAN